MRRRQNKDAEKCGGIQNALLFPLPSAPSAALLRPQHTHLNNRAHAFVRPNTHDLAVAAMKDGERGAAHPQPLCAARIDDSRIEMLPKLSFFNPRIRLTPLTNGQKIGNGTRSELCITLEL